MKGLEMRTGSLEERKKDKIKVHSPPCPKHACIPAYPIRASPSPRLLLFLSSLPMLCLGQSLQFTWLNWNNACRGVAAGDRRDRKRAQEDLVWQLSPVRNRLDSFTLCLRTARLTYRPYALHSKIKTGGNLLTRLLSCTCHFYINI